MVALPAIVNTAQGISNPVLVPAGISLSEPSVTSAGSGDPSALYWDVTYTNVDSESDISLSSSDISFVYSGSLSNVSISVSTTATPFVRRITATGFTGGNGSITEIDIAAGTATAAGGDAPATSNSTVVTISTVVPTVQMNLSRNLLGFRNSSYVGNHGLSALVEYSGEDTYSAGSINATDGNVAVGPSTTSIPAPHQMKYVFSDITYSNIPMATETAVAIAPGSSSNAAGGDAGVNAFQTLKIDKALTQTNYTYASSMTSPIDFHPKVFQDLDGNLIARHPTTNHILKIDFYGNLLGSYTALNSPVYDFDFDPIANKIYVLTNSGVKIEVVDASTMTLITYNATSFPNNLYQIWHTNDLSVLIGRAGNVFYVIDKSTLSATLVSGYSGATNTAEYQSISPTNTASALNIVSVYMDSAEKLIEKQTFSFSGSGTSWSVTANVRSYDYYSATGYTMQGLAWTSLRFTGTGGNSLPDGTDDAAAVIVQDAAGNNRLVIISSISTISVTTNSVPLYSTASRVKIYSPIFNQYIDYILISNASAPYLTLLDSSGSTVGSDDYINNVVTSNATATPFFGCMTRSYPLLDARSGSDFVMYHSGGIDRYAI